MRNVFLILMVVLIILVPGCQKKSAIIVNGKNITDVDFKNLYKLYKNQTDNKEEIKDDVINELILRKLIEEDAKKNNIEITEENINERIEKIIDSIGEESYQTFIETSGYTKESFRSNVRAELIYEAYRDFFFDGINLSEKDIEKQIEEKRDNFILLRAKHIFVKDKEVGEDALNELKDREFEDVAKEYSLDEIDLGYFSKGHMVEEFEDTAFDLEVGETSGLVKTDYGYHIIKLEERRDTKQDIREGAIWNMKNDKFEESLLKMRENAEIKINDEIIGRCL